jgi:hypothetical protein
MDPEASWYVFRHETDSCDKKDQLLAIWHLDTDVDEGEGYRDDRMFKYDAVREMLDTGDFSRIYGFNEPSREILTYCMERFVDAVDRGRVQ